MAAEARVAAQAKLNLFLHVLAREASGFHGIETLFIRLTLADNITVRLTASSRSIDCAGADVGPAESNLAYRAAAAFADATGWPTGFAIEIEKHIPVGGGLGGGSADAGAVLRALNALAPRPLPDARLLGVAATIGSDVPFLTTSHPIALAWGRGERMLALRPLPAVDVQLVCFPFGVSTAEAYGWVAATRAGATPSAPRVLDVQSARSWDELAPLAANDFEAVVASRHPPIARVLAAARESGAAIAQLSGSGSTVFVVPRVPRPGEGATRTERATGGNRISDALDAALPSGARIVRTQTATSVEDVVSTP